ncbi:MAG: peptidylprolyl isomerase, partial [Myxococcales bacterium]|nr:peptidylprolyl isomerase [Myxococcales bacterium]
RVRRAAARALARIGGAGARPGLLRALVDEDDEVVAWAAYGLGFACEGERDKTVRALVSAGAARLGASAGPTGAPVKNRGRLDATRAVVRAIGACAAEESETVLAAWTADARVAIDAAYALGDVATAREKLREDTYVTLLNLAAGDAAHDPLPEALYALGRVKTLPPSVTPRTLEVARARLGQAGPARVFAVRALGRVEDGAVASLEEVLRTPERFTPVERADAARALKRLGREGQKALARALGALAPKALDAAPANELVAEPFGVLLAVLESMGEIGEARPTLGALARLEAPKDATEAVRRRVSWLRCSAAKLLAERNYADEALQKCDLASSAAGQGWIGQRHVVEALGIAGAELKGARHATWRHFALEGELRAREAAVALVADHPELDDAAEVLAAALRAKEPGLQATAAEVLAKEPTRARVAPPKKKKPPPAETPVHPDIAAALAERLAATDADLEALGTAIDAAGALGLVATRNALATHCRSPYPSVREHAGQALAALDGSRTPVACDAAAGPGPRAPEREHLLAAPVRIRFASDVGELVLELDPSLAPVAVTRLADLARSGFFDDIVVHRVVPGFVSQLGSPTADGYGGAPLPPLRCETTPMPFEAGSVGIALAGRDTGGSQFFVTHALYPHLDGRYAWLGRAAGPWSALAEGDRIGAARVEGP